MRSREPASVVVVVGCYRKAKCVPAGVTLNAPEAAPATAP
jgi:hypothetical protein